MLKWSYIKKVVFILTRNFSNKEKKALEIKLLTEYKAVLTKKTYEKISINELVKKVGIAKGTFYLLFKDKESLFLNIIEGSINEIEQIVLGNEKQCLSIEDYFCKVLSDIAEFSKENKWLINASGAEYQNAMSNLSSEGKKRIEIKKEKVWLTFYARIEGQSTLSENQLRDMVSMLLIMNKYQNDLNAFDLSYSFMVNALAKQVFRRE